MITTLIGLQLLIELRDGEGESSIVLSYDLDAVGLPYALVD
jgi:hypothetical protein